MYTVRVVADYVNYDNVVELNFRTLKDAVIAASSMTRYERWNGACIATTRGQVINDDDEKVICEYVLY